MGEQEVRRRPRRRRSLGVSSEPRLLEIYLNDHLAGAAAGTELARRLARAHQGTPAGPELARLSTEIAEDRRTLQSMMAALGVPVRRWMTLAGWLGEKVGRLKPNGRFLSRSPLSSVIELEAMRLGVEGKLSGWRLLRIVAEHDRRLDRQRLDRLIERAERQSRLLEELWTRSVEDIIGVGEPAK